MNWFDVDKEGLAQLLSRKGKAFAVFELIQNAWDTNATKIDVVLRALNGPKAELIVTDDDPDGFADLRHAFTLFAPSGKKSDPEKRGRFNLGEKLVLAICDSAMIGTTTGGVSFDKDGRHSIRAKTEKGSIFKATIRMTRAELADTCRQVERLIAPADRETIFNGVRLPTRQPLTVIQATLPTEICDEEGILRRRNRETTIVVYDRLEGEPASLYEKGIPVMEFDGRERWHFDVQQKVPLTLERDSVPAGFLTKVRTEVLNAMHNRIEPDDAVAPWTRDAIASGHAIPEAVETSTTLRFGPKRVIYDPSDPEGTKIAMSQGYTVIPGGALSSGEWSAVKASGSALPAGQVTPSKPEGIAPSEPFETTSGMLRVKSLANKLGFALLGVDIQVNFVSAPQASTVASFGYLILTFNVGRLGYRWFEPEHPGYQAPILSLILHELGHYYEGDHLSEEYYRALTDLGARLAIIVARDPDFLETPK